MLVAANNKTRRKKTNISIIHTFNFYSLELIYTKPNTVQFSHVVRSESWDMHISSYFLPQDNPDYVILFCTFEIKSKFNNYNKMPMTMGLSMQIDIIVCSSKVIYSHGCSYICIFWTAVLTVGTVNTRRPTQNGSHFVDGIFRHIVLNGIIYI